MEVYSIQVEAAQNPVVAFNDPAAAASYPLAPPGAQAEASRNQVEAS